MKLHLLLKILLCMSCTGVIAGIDVDMRYSVGKGNKKWCVYCMQRDFEASLAESECTSNPFLVNLTEWNYWGNRKEEFWPICGTLRTKPEYYRYIRNCTKPPSIEGAEVKCSTDQNGHEQIRAHDTCSVHCTAPRTGASQPTTQCDPWTKTWTPVTCVPETCPPLIFEFGQDRKMSCNSTVDVPLNTTCEISCPRPEGYEPANRHVRCTDGKWLTVRECPPKSGCSHLSSIIVDGEETTCNVSKILPNNTMCQITCSEGYSPGMRIITCENDKWRPVTTCAPKGEIWKDELLIILPTVFGVIILILIVLGIIWLKCRSRDKKTKKQDAEEKSQSQFLLSSSSGSVSKESERRTPTDEETSFSERSEVTDDGKSEVLRPDDDPPPYSSHDTREHMLHVQGQPSSKGDLAVTNQCTNVQIYYARNDDRQGQMLPHSCEIQATPNSRLRICALCGNGHTIIQFYFGPTFIHDKHEDTSSGVTLTVSNETNGSYLVCAKCCGGGEVILSLLIRVTENPDETAVKSIYNGEDILGSLSSTVSGPTITAGSEPSKELQAVPLSLSSNPSLGVSMETDTNIAESGGATGRTVAGGTGGTVAGATGGTVAGATGGTVAGATGGTVAGATGGTVAAATGRTVAAATGGTLGSRKRGSRRSQIVGGAREGVEGVEVEGNALAPTLDRNGGLRPAVSNVSLYSAHSVVEDENDDVLNCTLMLTELNENRNSKLMDKLRLKLEPIDDRTSEKTIFGATLFILGFSVDKVEHIVWARRPDMRNTPARCLMSMMMQAGKRAGHLVRYFSREECHHHKVVDILKRAHPNCPFCKQY